VTVSLILQKLSSYPRQPRLGQALREVGRLERTFFSLAWYKTRLYANGSLSACKKERAATRWPGLSSSIAWAK
jgi:TnpA family transposase